MTIENIIIAILIAICSSYLVWQVATGDLTEDQ